MSTSSRTAWSTTAVCVFLMVAGCGGSPAKSSSANGAPQSSSPGTAAATSGGTPSSSLPADQGSGSASATSATVAAPPNPVRTSPSLPGGGPGNCLSGTVSVVYPAADNPLRSACVHLGTTVNVELLAIRGTTWSPPKVSDPNLASVSDQVLNGGTRHDTVRLLRPGTVTLASVSSYGPDPHGPASKQWTLTLTIVP